MLELRVKPLNWYEKKRVTLFKFFDLELTLYKRPWWIEYFIKSYFPRKKTYKPKKVDGYKSWAKNNPLGLALSMVKEPAYIFKDGKKIGLTNKREAMDYAKRNNLEFGSDDLEQQARANKDRIDREHTEQVSEKITEAYCKKQQQLRR